MCVTLLSSRREISRERRVIFDNLMFIGVTPHPPLSGSFPPRGSLSQSGILREFVAVKKDFMATVNHSPQLNQSLPLGGGRWRRSRRMRGYNAPTNQNLKTINSKFTRNTIADGLCLKSSPFQNLKRLLFHLSLLQVFAKLFA